MVELGAIYRLCVSACTALLKEVVSPSDFKITKWISLAQAANVGNTAVWDGLIGRDRPTCSKKDVKTFIGLDQVV